MLKVEKVFAYFTTDLEFVGNFKEYNVFKSIHNVFKIFFLLLLMSLLGKSRIYIS